MLQNTRLDMFQVENADIYLCRVVGQGTLVAVAIQNMQASRGGKHPLSGSRDWFNFQRNSMNNCFTVVETLYSEKKKKKRKRNFPARYWVALDQQKAVLSKKEFGSEIKLHDACSHLSKRLEKN